MESKSLFVLLALSFASCHGLTSETVEAAKADVYSMFETEIQYVSRTLRMIFHDCVSDTCDGCLNVNQQSNFGFTVLDPANQLSNMDSLEEIYLEKYATEMSRADFWVLAAITAIERATDKENGGSCDYGTCKKINVPPIEFKYGRVDCETSPFTDDDNDFPDATMTRTEMFDYMSSQFGFNTSQTVAIMGAHTIGMMHGGLSGYDGPFTAGDTKKFNNKYYIDMLDYEWTQNVNRKDVLQWDSEDEEGDEIGHRLNTDLELIYDFDINEDGSVDCSPISTCTVMDDTKAMVETYATDGDVWAYDFVKAFEDLVNKGYDNLSSVE